MRNEAAGTLVMLIWFVFTFGTSLTLIQCIKRRPEDAQRLANYGAFGIIILGCASLILGIMLQAHWEILPLNK